VVCLLDIDCPFDKRTANVTRSTFDLFTSLLCSTLPSVTTVVGGANFVTPAAGILVPTSSDVRRTDVAASEAILSVTVNASWFIVIDGRGEDARGDEARGDEARGDEARDLLRDRLSNSELSANE
jgi:hypothetical protein